MGNNERLYAVESCVILQTFPPQVGAQTQDSKISRPLLNPLSYHSSLNFFRMGKFCEVAVFKYSQFLIFRS